MHEARPRRASLRFLSDFATVRGLRRRAANRRGKICQTHQNRMDLSVLKTPKVSKDWRFSSADRNVAGMVALVSTIFSWFAWRFYSRPNWSFSPVGATKSSGRSSSFVLSSCLTKISSSSGASEVTEVSIKAVGRPNRLDTDIVLRSTTALISSRQTNLPPAYSWWVE
jgi:hypothetical protein